MGGDGNIARMARKRMQARLEWRRVAIMCGREGRRDEALRCWETSRKRRAQAKELLSMFDERGENDSQKHSRSRDKLE